MSTLRAVVPWLRTCIGALALLVLASATHAQPSLDAPEWSAIREVIEAQRVALGAGDAAKAFGYAAPGIRAQLGTPERFMAMVQSGYDVLLRARYTEFLEGAVIEGRVIQPLRLVLPDNTVYVALYEMQRQADGRWRIAGCVIAPSTVRAA